MGESASPRGSTPRMWWEARRRASARQLVRRFVPSMGLTAAPMTRVARTYLDTYDWRLFRSNHVLVEEQRDGQRVIVLQSRADARSDVAVPATRRPRTGHDLPDSVQRRVSAAVAKRSLVDVAHEHADVWPMRLLDDNGKTVAYVDVERVARDRDGSAVLVELRTVRGYETIGRGVATILDRQADLRRTDDPMVLAARVAGREPGAVPGPPPFTFGPADPGAVALAGLLERELATIVAFEDGVRHQLDPELLHDFRIAVRRTRSILTLARRRLPDDIVRVWKSEWAWLAAVTSSSRDLDVLAEELESARTELPGDAKAGLDELVELVAARRAHAQSAVRAALSGDRYGTLKRGWRESLREFAVTPSDDTAEEVARRLVGRATRQVTRQAAGVDGDSPAHAIHELRKRTKRLRYAVDLFGGVLPKAKVKAISRATKRLQSELGAFQDNEVHRDLVASLLEPGGQLSRDATLAKQRLVERYDARGVAARGGVDEQLRRFAKVASSLS